MSTFSRTTRSSSNQGKIKMNNLLADNKPFLGDNFNNAKNQLADKQPLKRAALTSTTNLLNKNILNDKVGDLNNSKNSKQSIKVSTTENAFNEPSIKTNKILGINRSRIPTRVGTKSDQQTVKNSKQEKTFFKKPENLLKFSSFIIPENVENIDQHDTNNVLLANDFSNDIYIYLSHLEEKFKLKTNFLQIQQQINQKMRARLVDWIIAVHHKFKLLSETLYLTIAIMDRFLEKISVAKDKVQLVGVTAFFIACKYEEIYPPEITDFIKVCDAYTKNEILKMEKTILKTLDFNLSYPLPLHFLRRFSKAAHADQEIHTLAKYLMELGLVEYECSSWKPSLLAASSLYLTLHILAADSKTQWTDTLAFYTHYKEDDLLQYVSYLCKVLLKQNSSKLQTIKTKYSNSKLLQISDNPKLSSEYVVKMSKLFE